MLKTGKIGARVGRARRRLLAALCALILSTVAVLAGASAANAGESPMCTYGVFISVRGTSADPGWNPTHNGRVWMSGGEGDQVGQLKSYVAMTDVPFFFESLNYPADGASLPASVEQGRLTLIDELNWLATQCTYPPAVVLAGHSQGAWVIMDALDGFGGLSTAAYNSIKAVALFGDPTYVSNRPYDAAGNGSNSGMFYRQDTSAQEGMRYWGWPQGSSNPNPTWVYKIRSWCFSGDFFCQNNAGDSNYSIHNSYKYYMSDPASWVNYMVTSAN